MVVTLTPEHTKGKILSELIIRRSEWQTGQRNDDQMDAATVCLLRRSVLKMLEEVPAMKARVVEARPVPRFGASWPFIQVASYPIGFNPNYGLWS